MGLNPLSLITSAVEGIGGVVVKGIETVKGNQKDRDAADAAQNAGTLSEFGSEFTQGRGTWFDSLIDGLNRLPRPAMAGGVIGLMILCPVNPVLFAEIMEAYKLVPDWIANLFYLVVTFYFGTKTIEKKWAMAGPSVEKVKAFVEAKKALNELRTQGPTLTPDEFKAEVADTSKPMSNAAIIAWNKARGR